VRAASEKAGVQGLSPGCVFEERATYEALQSAGAVWEKIARLSVFRKLKLDPIPPTEGGGAETDIPQSLEISSRNFRCFTSFLDASHLPRALGWGARSALGRHMKDEHVKSRKKQYKGSWETRRNRGTEW